MLHRPRTARPAPHDAGLSGPAIRRAPRLVLSGSGGTRQARGAEMSAAVRLAHLSDLHLPLAMPRGAEWLGKRGLSALNWQRRRHRHRAEVAERLIADLAATPADAVAMTGDMVNFSLPREFAAARGWLARLGPPVQTIALPGNHEALVPGWRRRLEAWGAYVRGPSGEDFPWTRTVGPVALIAVSTAIATPPFVAAGRVGAPARDRIAQAIERARGAGHLPVVLMHHPPTRITIRRKGLIDGAAMRALLGRAGAALVLHGHTHAPDLSWIDGRSGRIPVLGVPACSMAPGQVAAPGAWRLIEIERGPQGWRATVTERAITKSGDVAAMTPFRLALPGPEGCGEGRAG